jgi:diaminohydroxyphosphoribosylaminopyrimidine deaminase/5-amino-6-(5-phosphoribosylamino)uracil reductase
LVHKWRTEEQAILVGTNTVLEDNPNLTVRDWAGNNPIRIVLDKDLKLDISSSVFNGNSKTVILSSKNDNGRTVETIDWTQKDTIAQQICNRLHKLNINSVIIEGGAQTLQTFIDENLWDEVRVFEGSITFKDGLKTPSFEGHLIKEKQILDDTLSYYVQN